MSKERHLFKVLLINIFVFIMKSVVMGKDSRRQVHILFVHRICILEAVRFIEDWLIEIMRADGCEDEADGLSNAEIKVMCDGFFKDGLSVSKPW